MIGFENGKLKVIAAAGVRVWDAEHRESLWKCRCACGNETIIPRSKLKRNTSCGCQQGGKGVTGRRAKWQEGCASYNMPEYRSWRSMLGRCHNPNNPAYARYGGRGIKVFKPWHKDFGAFRDYMGAIPSDGHSLERIDNNGDYGPGNVRWATAKEQARNRRNQRTIVFNGVAMPLIAAVEMTGVKYVTALWRLNRGLPPEEALKPPVKT